MKKYNPGRCPLWKELNYEFGIAVRERFVVNWVKKKKLSFSDAFPFAELYL
jgi:hypothetical protein